jgi:hypothetical protein
MGKNRMILHRYIGVVECAQFTRPEAVFSQRFPERSDFPDHLDNKTF